jgi:hypothetical protein
MGTVLLAALASLMGAAPGSAQTPRPAPSAAAPVSSLSAVRRATERFRKVEVALAEGYVPDPSGMCMTSTMEGQPTQLGGMGIHYFRPDLLGITGPPDPRVSGTGTHTDFTRPGVLVYEPQKDGSLQLVAVENLVFQQAWRAAGNTAPPAFLGNEYYSMVDNPLTDVDEAHGFEPHYELHLWLYRENPSGTFVQFNTRVTCANAPAHGGHTTR